MTRRLVELMKTPVKFCGGPLGAGGVGGDGSEMGGDGRRWKEVGGGGRKYAGMNNQ